MSLAARLHLTVGLEIVGLEIILLFDIELEKKVADNVRSRQFCLPQT